MSGWFFKNSDLPDSKGKGMFNSDGKPSNPMGFGIAIGCGIGVALGNLVIGIAIGAGIGAAFGSALRKQSNRKEEQSEKLD